MDTLDAVASSLDRFEAVQPRLAELGRLHASYGALPGHYDTLVQAMRWARISTRAPVRPGRSP